MKLNAWTVALIGAGLTSLPAVTQGEEKTTPITTALSSTTISGYVDTSAQWNIDSGNVNVPTYAFGGPAKADGFNLNVVNLVIEKPVDPSQDWGTGYKVNLIFGPDANALGTQSSGVPADFGVRQAYVTLHAPVGSGLDFKLGVWDTICGYEVFDSPLDPNFTRSYGYTIEPTTHTGLLATYQFGEALSASAGIADSMGSPINGRSSPPDAPSFFTYLGLLTLTAPKDWGFLAGSTLSGCIISGYNPNVGSNQTSYYAGATINTPLNGFKVGVAYDYASVVSEATVGPAYANAIGAYLLYQITPKLSLNGRAEYGSSNTLVGGKNVFAASKVIETTATLQYDIWKNVLTRLEFRWDHAADGSDPYGGTTPGLGIQNNSYILLANVTYKF